MNTPSHSLDRGSFINSLTEELEPVRSHTSRDGALWVAFSVMATVIGVALLEGVWHGMFQGEAAPFFWVTNGLLLLLGLSASSAVITMASPHVGNQYSAPRWAAAMVAVLPAAALITLFSTTSGASGAISSATSHCAWAATLSTFLSGGVLTMWLRRGAPVSLNLAGWMTGLAAGGLGSAAYGISCQYDSVAHLGIAHVLPVGIAAVIGRLVVPRLVRW